jgi:protein-S-isoprenylcysteine O-methyltransferase Ste14
MVTAPWLRIVGGILAVASLCVVQWAWLTMRRAGTSVLPSKPTLAIVTDGPYRFTRNPPYVANALLYLGLTLVFEAFWPLVLMVPMLVVIHWGLIRREEQYLETKFGDAYRAYKSRVRRWL